MLDSVMFPTYSIFTHALNFFLHDAVSQGIRINSGRTLNVSGDLLVNGYALCRPSRPTIDRLRLKSV